MAIEKPDYEVLMTEGDIEFRRYAPYLIAEVTVTGAKPDRKGFSILAGYIFGNNVAEEKMNMTAPVETRGSDYAFVMERKYSLDTLPEPNDDRIRLLQRPGRVVAVRRFSGRWTESNFARHEKALLEQLASMDVDISGPAELARYNSPFTPWFLRRNEILVPVDWSSVSAPGRVAAGTPPRL